MTVRRLLVRGASRTFPGGAGVHGIDLDVLPGEIHALVGLNGAGKSTLMRIALGMLRAHSGTVEIDGRDVRAAGPGTWASVGHLVEHPLAYGELSVRRNLEIGATLHGVPGHAVAPMVDSVLAELDLAAYASIRARSLSLGNRQRLGLASALQHRPGLLVLDEPTNALDPSGVLLLREALVRRAADGAGVLVSSHHLDEVARVATRITVVNDGRVVGALDPWGVDIERSFFAQVRSDTEARRGVRP